MRRFLSIALIASVIGFSWGCSSDSTPPSARQSAASDVPVGEGPELRAAGNAAAFTQDAPEATTSAQSPAESESSDSGKTAAAGESDVEAVPASASQDTTESDAPESDAPVANADANANDDPTQRLPTEKLAKPAPIATEEIMLGDPSLTSGVPGVGPLTIEEIQAWLNDSKNHAVITPVLPLGLAAAASQIVGLDVNPLTRAKIELGRQLYFDTRLSQDNTISCASCHDPEFGYAKDTQFGVGVGGQTGTRNSPVAYNRILSAVQFWDGRAPSLEEQAKGPIANPIEMSNTHDVCVSHLADIEGYRLQFEKIFPDGVEIDNVAKAIASFERALVTAPSPWDYHEQLRNFQTAYAADLEDLDGLKQDDPELFAEYVKLKAAADANPLDESAKHGGELFFSERVGCTACHVGANFTDELYHNIGVGMDAAESDLGRYVVTKDEKDRGAFKTPTVRNVALTGPYMHDGSQKTLEEIVEWYNKGGHPNSNLDPKIKPLNLTEQEKTDLVAFMKALTGELPKVERGRLPEG